MHKIIPFLIVLAACNGRKKEPGKTYSFSGVVTQTSSYCGGARPSEEILDQYNKARPYGGKVLHVREGKNNAAGGKVVLKIVTDDSGYFSASLPPGRYCIVQEEQLKPLDISLLTGGRDKPVSADTNCLRNWWKGALSEIDLSTKEVSGLKINFHHPCFVSGDLPCIRYVGPMPP